MDITDLINGKPYKVYGCPLSFKVEENPRYSGKYDLYGRYATKNDRPAYEYKGKSIDKDRLGVAINFMVKNYKNKVNECEFTLPTE